MTDQERKELIKQMEEMKKKVLASPEEARKLLVGAGIYTEKGNLRKPYK